jgi:Flp pilus assembly protein TadD
MNRSLARLAAILLLGASVAACSSLDGSGDNRSASNGTSHEKSGGKSLASDIDAQVRNAQALRAHGDYAGATRMLAQLMLVAPDNSNVVGEYGKALVEQGRPRDALDFLSRAVQLQPGDWTLYSAMGVAYDQSGDYAKARSAYQQALAIQPANPGVLNNYALSRMQAGDLSGARQLMTQASGAAATNPRIARNVALLASLTPSQPAQAKNAAAATAAGTRGAPVHATTLPAIGANVVMQQVPVDSKSGPVKAATRTAPANVATSAPRPIVKETPTSVAQAAPPAKVAAKPVVSKVAKETTKKPASDKTPSLRMTADAGAP